MYVPKGVDVPCLTRDVRWAFTPGKFKEGEPITGGDIIGEVYEVSFPCGLILQETNTITNLLCISSERNCRQPQNSLPS